MRSLSCAFLAIVILSAGLVSSAQAGDSTNLYRNKSYTFSIVFPTGWQQRIGQTPSTVVVSENQQGDSIIIQVRPLPQNVTLDNYPDSKLRAVISDVFSELKRKFNDALMHDSGVTYICNEKTIWMRYTYSIKQAFVTRKITTQYYQVWHDGKLFGILCSASSERYAQVSSTLLNSVRSFIFDDLFVEYPGGRPDHFRPINPVDLDRMHTEAAAAGLEPFSKDLFEGGVWFRLS